MKNNYHDSYCGNYCGACDIMMADRTGGKYKISSFWNSKNIERYQNILGNGYDRNQPVLYKCDGCKGDNLFINCASCRIRKCAIDNKIDHCLDCSSYPCSLINELYKAASLLPHLKINHYNMKKIREGGIATWLSEQKERWKCPECKTDISWYTDKCKNCGMDMTKNSYKFTFIQASIMKLGIYIASRRAKRKQT